MHQAKLWRKIKDQQVQCLACNWYCQIKEKQTGVRGVRINQAGKLYLSVYSRPVSVNLDPSGWQDKNCRFFTYQVEKIS